MQYCTHLHLATSGGLENRGTQHRRPHRQLQLYVEVTRLLDRCTTRLPRCRMGRHKRAAKVCHLPFVGDHDNLVVAGVGVESHAPREWRRSSATSQSELRQVVRNRLRQVRVPLGCCLEQEQPFGCGVSAVRPGIQPLYIPLFACGAAGQSPWDVLPPSSLCVAS